MFSNKNRISVPLIIKTILTIRTSFVCVFNLAGFFLNFRLINLIISIITIKPSPPSIIKDVIIRLKALDLL